MPDESDEIAAETQPDAHQDAAPQPGGMKPDEAPVEDAGADAPADDGRAREMVSRAELEKVIAQRQAAKARAREAEQKLAELEGRLNGGGADASPGEDREDDATTLTALQDENLQLKRQLTSVLRDQGLRAAASAAGAINPDQVVALLRPKVQMDLAEDGRLAPSFLGEDGRPIADDEAVPDLQTFVGLFLSLPENANLVKANTTPGSGARPAGRAAEPLTRPRSLEEFNGLPEADRMQWALEMGPERLRTLLGLGRPQDQGFL